MGCLARNGSNGEDEARRLTATSGETLTATVALPGPALVRPMSRGQ